MSQASCAIAEGRFTAAEGYTVVFCFFEPVCRLPVTVVVNPTTVQLQEKEKG